MLGLHDYFFWVQDSNYLFYQLDANGLLTLTANEYHLEKAPTRWEELAVECIRNDKYFGLDRSISASLVFVGDGARILKKIFAKFGHEADCFLTIGQKKFKQSGLGYSFEYLPLYRAQVDFNTFKHNGPVVTCGLSEDGIVKYLKAQEATPFELDMIVPAAMLVKMDGVKLQNSVNYFVSNGTLPFDNRQHTLNMELINQEANQELNAIGTERTAFLNNAGLFGSDQFFLTTEHLSQPTTVTLKYSLGFTVSLATGITPNPVAGGLILVREFNTAGVAVAAETVVAYGGNMNFHQHHQLDGSVTFVVPPGRRLFLCHFVTSGGVIITGDTADGVTFWTYDNKDADSIKLLYDTRFAPTYIYHLPAQYVYEQLINKVTEGRYSAAISQLFASVGNIAFTSGDAVRQKKDANGNLAIKLVISFLDFFKFLDYRFNAGLSEANGIIRLEKKVDLINVNNIIDLPSPALTPVFYCNSKTAFNEYEYGYPKISNEVGILNGTQEFCCKCLRSLGVIMNPKKISRVSPIRASCMEQENMRIKFYAKDTTDSKNDNNPYVNALETVQQPAAGFIPAHYRLDRSINPSVTGGLIDPSSVWNLFLRPQLMFEANGNFIRSSFYQCDQKTFNFITADKNGAVEVNGVLDNRPMNMGGLATPYMIPYNVNLEVPAPENIMDNLNINPLQVFRFYLEGQAYLWIPQKISSGSVAKQLQPYELISFSTNDIDKIANYEG